MIGFLVHLHTPWCGVRHLLISARDEFHMLELAAQMAPLRRPGEWERSRVVRCFVNQEQWNLWHAVPSRQLCSMCIEQDDRDDQGRYAA